MMGLDDLTVSILTELSGVWIKLLRLMMDVI